MSELKATPGPWGPETFVSIRGDAVQVAFLCAAELGSNSDIVARANLALIAAAPELYEILQAVCDFSDAFRDGELPSDPEAAELYRKSRAALAKARGQKLAA